MANPELKKSTDLATSGSASDAREMKFTKGELIDLVRAIVENAQLGQPVERSVITIPVPNAEDLKLQIPDWLLPLTDDDPKLHILRMLVVTAAGQRPRDYRLSFATGMPPKTASGVRPKASIA
jgi:hypothetical protein